MPFPVGRIPDRFSSLTVEIPPKMDKGTSFSKDGEKVVPLLINTKGEQVSNDYPSTGCHLIKMKRGERPSDFFLKNFYCNVSSYDLFGSYVIGRHIYFYPYKEGVEPTYQTFKTLFLRVFNDKVGNIKEVDIEAIQQKNSSPFVLQVIRVIKVKSSVFEGHVRERGGQKKWVVKAKKVVVQPICVRAFGTKAGLYILQDKKFTDILSVQTKEWFNSFKKTET